VSAASRPVSSHASRRVTRIGVPLLLALHAALVIPGMLRNSATFDENFHLPAGALYLARGYTHVSLAQPPLARALFALPVMAMRPVLPPDSLLKIGAERSMAESFVNLNAARFQRLLIVARMVGLLLSLLLGWLIFRLARECYGSAAGLFALAAWVTLPDVVAHAGLVGVDLPTALAFMIVILAFRAFVRRPGALTWVALTIAVGATLLTRFSALQLVPVLAILAIVAIAGRRFRSPGLLAWTLAAALIGGFVLLDLGYLGQVSFLPLGQRAVISRGFHAWASSMPWLRLPFPDAYIAGFDYLRDLTESHKAIYLLGTVRSNSAWFYFPVAMAVKWPLGWLGLLVARASFAFGSRARRGWDEACLLLPAAVILGVAMTSDLDYGVRYLIPALPFLCVWSGGLLARTAAWRGPRPRSSRWAAVAGALLVLQAGECAISTPWQLSFFNVLAGDRGDRIVNDSNVDWGQGLLALRDEMRRRGIERIHLAYHGSLDPGVYGISYLPYLGGAPGAESDWLAVSSYLRAGLPAQLVTARGDTPFIQFDPASLAVLQPVARPARCMYLYRLRAAPPRN
jgi:hypothetical protein